MPRWIEDVAAAVEAVGADKPGLVFGIAATSWESAEQRNEFLSTLTGKDMKDWDG